MQKDSFYAISGVEEWMDINDYDPSNFSLEDCDNGEGIVTHLLENQYDLRHNTQKRCIRFIDQITDQVGVSILSKIPIDFMETYQKVKIHHLKQIRNGTLINQLEKAHFQLIACDRRQDGKDFQGWKTLNIILNDIQVNDVIDICYSVHGCDPKIGENFSTSWGTQYRCPIALQKIRVVFSKKKKLFFKSDREDIVKKVINSKVEGCKELLVCFKPTTLNYLEDNIPIWCKTRKSIQISTFKSWGDVVGIILPYYKRENGVDLIISAVDEICEDCDTIEQKILALINYVQKNIRYLSFPEIDLNICPSDLRTIITNKFGDCKDKTYVLLAFLDAIGIECYPALVSDSEPFEPGFVLPCSNVFDHIIVLLRHAGKEYWIDPTFHYQEGTIENRSIVNKGYALIISNDQDCLTKIPLQQTREVVFKDYFDLSNYPIGQIPYHVTSTFRGSAADFARNYYASRPKKQVGDLLLENLYRRYEKIYSDAPLVYEDDRINNIFVIKEFYVIEDFSSIPLHKDNFLFHFWELSSYVPEIQNLNRDYPYSVLFPNEIHQIIEIKTNSESESENEVISSSVVEHDAFFYKNEIREEGDKVFFSGQYKALKDHVHVDAIEEYKNKAEMLIKKTYFTFLKEALEKNEKKNFESNEPKVSGLAVLVNYGLDEPNKFKRFLKRGVFYIAIGSMVKFGLGGHKNNRSRPNKTPEKVDIYTFSTVKPLHEQLGKKRSKLNYPFCAIVSEKP